jgi:ADP-dependent NAD(P)H-hydrate dehydratase / NAD(P)H-hydrate epimerase
MTARRIVVTAAAIRRFDAQTIHTYGIPAHVLMDHAGKAVAEAVRRLAGNPRAGPIWAVCGGGHNGGDGVVAARWLKGWGYDARVFWLQDPAGWKGGLALHRSIALKMRVPFRAFVPSSSAKALKRSRVLIDALLGTGTTGELRPLYREAIEAINASRRPVVAVDIPSGLHADTGEPLGTAVRASVTVTIGALKSGLVQPSARSYVGRLEVADIGIPVKWLSGRESA